MPPDVMYLFQELLLFGRSLNLASNRIAGRKQLWDILLAPFDRVALSPLPQNSTYTERLIHVATCHLREHPREIGGPNRGPWVRLYMRGHDGNSFPWCAGFVSTVTKQAAGSALPPVPYCYSCSALAGEARSRGMLLTAPSPEAVQPGWIFLCRRKSSGWGHTGFVDKVNGDWFTSIEGNANASGGTEGVEVCRRVRKIAGKDFIVMGR